MGRSNLTTIAERVQRISCCGMHVDLVSTSEGVVRIGSMPDIAKFLFEHGVREEVVVVPSWRATLAGDNRTGEEFILWAAEKRGGLKKDYVGEQSDVDALEHHLGSIFPYFFDERRLSIVHEGWLGKWFRNASLNPVYRKNDLEIVTTASALVVKDGGKELYRLPLMDQSSALDENIERYLASISRDRKRRAHLEIVVVGCGNGFTGTVSNSIVRFGECTLWIDPCGFPAHSLGQYGIHWDDVTHYLFTHNHEDHTQGFTACLHRAKIKGRPLQLLVAKSVFRLLKELYSPLFPDLPELVEVRYITPGEPLELGPMKIESRWNHHILPYGSIGLKISAGGRCFGYSGDTKYDEELNSLLQRPELMADWFQPCDLVFHEIDFDNPDSVHTHWTQVKALAGRIPGKVLGYHTNQPANAPFELVREGCRYILKDRLKVVIACCS